MTGPLRLTCELLFAAVVASVAVPEPAAVAGFLRERHDAAAHVYRVLRRREDGEDEDARLGADPPAPLYSLRPLAERGDARSAPLAAPPQRVVAGCGRLTYNAAE